MTTAQQPPIGGFREVWWYVLLALRTHQCRAALDLLASWAISRIRRIPLVLNLWLAMLLDWLDAHPRVRESVRWFAFLSTLPGFLLVEVGLFAFATGFLLWVMVGCAADGVQPQRAALLVEHHEGLDFRQFARSLGVSRWVWGPLYVASRIDSFKIALQPQSVTRIIERLNAVWRKRLWTVGSWCGLHVASYRRWLRLTREHWRGRPHYRAIVTELGDVLTERRIARHMAPESQPNAVADWQNIIAPGVRTDIHLN